MKIGDKIEHDGKTYEAVEENKSSDCIGCDVWPNPGECPLGLGDDCRRAHARLKLVEDEPWTPKNGEVVEVRDSDSEEWATGWKFVGIGIGGNFICEDREWHPESWEKIRQVEPPQDPRLFEAQAENARLKEELNDLGIKLKEILDRVERVS